MPAEKLTKRRFLQILIMLGILIFVFLYRTYHYSDEPNEEFRRSEPFNRTQSAVNSAPVLKNGNK
ncbi:hypothetical protein CBG46_08070 [Actinobacillus succinogenes]|uniref:Uncharacterized protein n=1 Tax=Actinobacillus succinogenes (strain ATCC 55618 / DSM 22257 / CCUG 43843 / 130Z) TaxID=339671 RepID=A6VPR6_ACTSZ|nr:hypothetical protein [Actinobacillus succinogenes]ABR74963.1 hypothetical protein Asuc_1609 [Actinobacillus succinogenes 130Z]PHI40627.1 hypothetical protein CBG46_08070 [Actinobacillus succinogenes]